VGHLEAIMQGTVRSEIEGQIPVLDELAVDTVKDQLRQHSVVVIRAGGATVEDFEALTGELITPIVHHATSTVERDAVNADATTSTVNKGSDLVPLHREGSYAPRCPDLLAFYCVKPADRAGETTVCDGVRLRDVLPEEVRAATDRTQLRWTWTAPRERWQAMLGAATPAEATARLTRMAASLSAAEKLEFEFAGDTLCGTFLTPCIVPTRWGDRRAFCNSLLIYHYRQRSEYFAKDLLRVTAADGSPVPEPLLAEVNDRAREITVAVRWQPRDMLIVDNSRYMHGRNGFTDLGRRVLIRMGHARGAW
jgi:alpha-ketoglutarate-dependent taurine dioxygenase